MLPAKHVLHLPSSFMASPFRSAARLFLASLFLASPAFAQDAAPTTTETETPPPVVATPPADVARIDSADVDAFMNGFMEALLESENIAGATVSIVQDGQILLARGYGMADVENEIAVDPATTLFRIGSISKLFVWTTVMQEFEKGRINLTQDVNTYMGEVQIPDTYDQPVTMTHLMTHTPGFEDRVIGLFRRTEEEVGVLKDVLIDEMPKRVRPPGEIASYSNHGTAMAAHAVATVANQDWYDYVEQHVMLPLGLHHTTFRQPVPDSIAAGMSKGYKANEGSFEEEGFEYIPLAPVGAASASATDMATFMITHLNRGQYGDVSIMAPTTAHRMQQPLFRHAGSVNAQQMTREHLHMAIALEVSALGCEIQISS